MGSYRIGYGSDGRCAGPAGPRAPGSPGAVVPIRRGESRAAGRGDGARRFVTTGPKNRSGQGQAASSASKALSRRNSGKALPFGMNTTWTDFRLGPRLGFRPASCAALVSGERGRPTR